MPSLSQTPSALRIRNICRITFPQHRRWHTMVSHNQRAAAHDPLANSSPSLEILLMTTKKTAKKRPTPQLTASPRAVLPGSEKTPFVPSAAVQAAGETPAPSGAKITVSVVVRRKAPLKVANRTGKERLTHAQYRQSHAADPVAVKLVRAFAKESGLPVAPDTPGPERRTIKLTGTIANMQKAFGVTLVHKAHEGATYRVREGSITLPA